MALHSSLTGADLHAPGAHAAQHATAGSDPLAPSDLGAAPAVHQHSGADLTSGTVPSARLGSGTASATTFLRGDQTWATPAGGGGSVGGTGTAGRAAFWSAVSTLSAIANSIYWDSVNNRLGIGTEAPGAAFHVDSSNRLTSPTAGTAQTFSTTIDAFPISGTSNVTAYSVIYTPPTQPSGTRILSSIRPSVLAASDFSYGLTMRAVNAAATFSGTGTLSGITSGVFGQVSSTGAGILSAAYGVAGFLQATSTGKITTGSALRALQPQSANVGNYGDTYGLYVEDQVPSGGATHQTGTPNGIYQAGTTTINTFKGPTVFDGAVTFNGAVTGGGGTLDGLSDVTNSSPQTGQILRKTSGDYTNQYDYAAIAFVIDGGGAAITTGIKGDIIVPFACVIVQSTLLADVSGSIVVDIWRDTYANYPPVVGDSITASAKPTISSGLKAQDATLTGWLTTCAAGDTIRFNVDSAATIGRCTVSLRVRKT